MTVLERSLALLGLGLTLTLSSGCQTWNMDAGVTMPTADYLNHPPQYFPRSPEYPLPRELKSLQDANHLYEQYATGQLAQQIPNQ